MNTTKKFYFELEIDFPKNDINYDDKENNRNNINIYAKILNQKADSYFEFPLENKGISLITNISTESKIYHLYESNNEFKSGVKSLFFFVNHRGKNPNCTIKYGTYKEKPIRYENNLIIINQEKNFSSTYEIFFLSLNLAEISLFSNDNFYIIFKGKKDAFISNKVNYRTESNKANYNINGVYSICQDNVKEDGEEKSISCFIPNKSTKYLNLILYLNKNYEINVRTELIYKINFIDILSCNQERKYIISNNASDNYNYYIFFSDNYDFNIDGFTYNTIDNLDNFNEFYPIEDKREVMGSVDKRVYVKINNKENKNFIGFKTGFMSIPFKIIKTTIDESNTKFVNYTQKFKFNLEKNIPLLFVVNFNIRYGYTYIKFNANIKPDYFNNITYFINYGKFESFS